MPDAARAVNGYPPGSSQGRDATLVPTSSDCVSTRQRQRTYVHRSSSRPIPDAIEPRLFPLRSAQRSSANAPVGGLKPPPEGRLRRAIQPPSLLQHRSQWDHHLPIVLPPAFAFTTSSCRFIPALHNSHHAFATSARRGLSRWQLDPGAWLISTLEGCHLAWDVISVSPARQHAKRGASGRSR